MLQLDLLPQYLASSNTELRQAWAIVGADLEVLASDVDNAKVISTPGDVGAQASKPWHVERDVLSYHIGRHVLEATPLDAIRSVGNLANDWASGGFETDGRPPIRGLTHHS